MKEATSHMASAETSDRVSSLAARWQRKIQGRERTELAGITVGELGTLCASLVRQDETKGLRAKLRTAVANARANKAKLKP